MGLMMHIMIKLMYAFLRINIGDKADNIRNYTMNYYVIHIYLFLVLRNILMLDKCITYMDFTMNSKEVHIMGVCLVA